ncbi:Ent-kaurene synthase [Quillaja saponaria]|uniref:ent-kaurene synthase n=1 Tax=Quillaja saponaria TaxID=32244 RepID=A0AAD7VNJ6_QUISA|nr:Ent-kaurene synthase [Quillaja saponaria]
MFSLSSTASAASPILAVGLNVEKQINRKTLSFEVTIERIKKMFDKVELSVSSYDTAWVAMIPSPISSSSPFFPQCVNWLLDNQHFDGSWGLTQGHPLLMKDSLLSTLACILALKQWGVGEKQMNRGLQFIESNFALACDEKQHSPIGFDIIFPSLIEQAQNLDLNISPGATNIKELRHKRELELQRGYASNSEGWRTYLAYISEGLGKSQDWQTIIKYQRKNGSLFNSPATTAVAFTHLQNSCCLSYLQSLLEMFGNAVPTVCSLDIYARLCMVETLERLGISRHFREEIKAVLDETYRYWLQGEEDLFQDSTTCALAFRLLRVNGYNISLDPLSRYSEDKFSNSLGGYLKDVGAALELYKASEIIIDPNESVLLKLNSWTRQILEQQLSSFSLYGHTLYKNIEHEVKSALSFPYHAKLDRLSERRAIEQYKPDNVRILKTSYSCLNLANKEFLKLAVEDFNICQSIYIEEYKQFERWTVERRLDKVKLASRTTPYCYFSAAVAVPEPELSDARISWAKNALLITVVDDFYDWWGSEEEMINLIQLVEKWKIDANIDCCSESVEIIFSAIRDRISEIVKEAFKRQGHNVKSDVTDIWLDAIRNMCKEAEWSRTKYVPTMDEYRKNGYLSIALGPIVLPLFFLVGPKLPKNIFQVPQVNYMFELMNACGRLLNDIRGFKRESEQGKLNAVTLRVLQGGGDITEEEAIKEIEKFIADKTRELLRLVLQEKGSKIPRVCRELFWRMTKVLHLFYLKDDGYTSVGLVDTATALFREPIVLKELLVEADKN